MTSSITGGCQCGSMRYRIAKLGTASICHCRMCQKAFGNYFAPLADTEGFEWTRGKPGKFVSSNLSTRGFCKDCGTPLTLETSGQIEVAIGSLDDPSFAMVEYHANVEDRHALVMAMAEISEATAERAEENTAWNAKIVSYQHPDRDTPEWPPETFMVEDHA